MSTTPFFDACRRGETEAALQLARERRNIDAPDPKDPLKRNALMIAVDRGHLEIVRGLLDLGADIEAADAEGTSTLSIAATCKCPEGLEMLLDRGAQIESRCINGWTPLIKASLSGAEPGVRVLLDRGAEIEARDVFGLTALMRAARLPNPAVARLLLERGASRLAKDDKGRRAIDHAMMLCRGGVAQALFEHGEDPDGLFDGGPSSYAERLANSVHSAAPACLAVVNVFRNRKRIEEVISASMASVVSVEGGPSRQYQTVQELPRCLSGQEVRP
jgi:ankyrin repeat protein